MSQNGSGATWLASYPKSGNTWLRCLLEAYHRGGLVDINGVGVANSDANAVVIQGVSTLPLSSLGLRGELLVRPAALLNLISHLRSPRYLKTHFANVQLQGLPPCVPREFTNKAIYIIRDPRSVVLSFSRFYSMPIEKAIAAMANNKQTIGGPGTEFGYSYLSSWSNNVSSWAAEGEFPVHLVKYEEMMADPEKEFREILEFLEYEIDDDLVKLSIEAASFKSLKNQETTKGFKENPDQNTGDFFHAGGTRWEEELAPKWIKKIESDHRLVMEAFGYLESEVAEGRSSSQNVVTL